MRVLGEVLRHPDAPKTGRAVERAAVRAIVRRGRELLLVYSPVNGDYKFPGGGVQPGETPAQALARELREECGARLTASGPAFGRMIEYDRPQESGFDLFRMTSDYYICTVADGLSAQQLDGYEHDLGFRPVWIASALALHANREVLRAARPNRPEWTRRETFVLELLARTDWS